MTVVGTAEILVLPKTDEFERKLKASGALSGFAGDAEAAGETAGQNLAAGVGKGAKKAEDDLDRAGREGGSKLTGGLKKALSGLGGLGLPTGFLVEGLNKAEEASKSANHSMTGLGSTLDRVGGAALLGGTAALAAFGAEGIHVAESMQTADTAIANATGDTVANAKAIGDAFLGTAGKTEFSGEQIASAYASIAGQLKSAEGYTLGEADALKVMTASQDLATASGVDLATTTKVLGGIMQAYQIPVQDAAHVTDVLFQTSQATGQSIDTLATAMEKIKAKMGAAAPGINGISTLLVDLADHGLTGRTAITAVSTAFSNLIAPAGKLTKAQQEIADEQRRLGLSFANSQGHLRDMGVIIGQVSPLIKGMSAANAEALLKSIGFGNASGKLVSTIQAGLPAWQAARETTMKNGAAQDAAAKQAKTLHVEMQTIKATATDVAASFGQILIPIVQEAGHIFIQVTGFLLHHKGVLEALGVLVGGALSVAIGVFVTNKMVAFGKSFTEATKAIGNVITKIPEAISSIMGLGTAATVSADEVEAGSAASATALEGVGEASTVMAADVEGAAVATDAAIGSTGIGAILIGLGIAITLLATHWKQVWGFIKDVALDVWHFLDNDVIHPIERAFDWVVREIKAHWDLVLPILLGPIGAVIFAWRHWGKQITALFGEVRHDIAHWFDVIVQDALAVPEKIISFFESLPGRIINFIENAGASVAKAFLSWIPGGGVIGNALSFIGLAEGGIVHKPTLAVVGEAGPEAVVPLKHFGSSAAQSIVRGGDVRPITQAGSPNSIAPRSTSTAHSSGNTIIHLTINGSNMTPEQTVSEIGWLAHTGAFR